jgi:imidazolonepropionase-like amidohydrolase
LAVRFALKEAIEDDVFPGPRLFIANKAQSQTGGHGDFRSPHDTKHTASTGVISEVVDGVPDCTRTARKQLRQGADFIKITANGGLAH